jgi:hypothetical protein
MTPRNGGKILHYNSNECIASHACDSVSVHLVRCISAMSLQVQLTIPRKQPRVNTSRRGITSHPTHAKPYTLPNLMLAQHALNPNNYTLRPRAAATDCIACQCGGAKLFHSHSHDPGRASGTLHMINRRNTQPLQSFLRKQTKGYTPKHTESFENLLCVSWRLFQLLPLLEKQTPCTVHSPASQLRDGHQPSVTISDSYSSCGRHHSHCQPGERQCAKHLRSAPLRTCGFVSPLLPWPTPDLPPLRFPWCTDRLQPCPASRILEN